MSLRPVVAAAARRRRWRLGGLSIISLFSQASGLGDEDIERNETLGVMERRKWRITAAAHNGGSLAGVSRNE